MNRILSIALCIIASSGISGVVADTKRLIPDGNFIEPSLWIRSSQTSDAKSMIEQWLKDIDYSSLTANVEEINMDETIGKAVEIYSLSGQCVLSGNVNLQTLPTGKQLLPQEEAECLLMSATSRVLAVNGDNGYPYAIPVSFVICCHIYFIDFIS